MKKNIKHQAKLFAEEVPVPYCTAGSVVIANHYSLISAGTETSAVRGNKKDMVVKALTDPEIRKSLKDMIFQDGIIKTIDRVHFEMTKWTRLGYSGAGMAIEVGADIEKIQIGDYVAYAGEGHAEYIRAMKNLCVKIPEGVSLNEAAFVALGSIAIQGLRQTEIQVGDVVAVIGLGLVGQLACQMLQVAGARILAIDKLQTRINLATSLGAEQGFLADDQIAKDLLRYTGGIGVDRVLICASTTSNVVIEQAIQISRDRGRIVLLGFVGLDIPQEQFYQKELELRISRSYGPGRYDPLYEEQGIDYPIGYVRWTEKRNMQEFLRLLKEKKITIHPLISHEFPLKKVEDAYNMLIKKPNECLAVLLRYNETPKAVNRNVVIRPIQPRIKNNNGPPNIAVIGCGAFARQFHLPNLKASSELNFYSLISATGQNAKEMALRYGASNCATDWREIIEDKNVDAVMVFTRDKSHAAIATEALQAGKHVFCEKPLAITYQECKQISEALQKKDGPFCMVGFNRRFAPFMTEVKNTLNSCKGKYIIYYRVNAGPLPKDHWVYDSAHGAGRIIGEACHFIDLFYYLLNVEPVRVFAEAIGERTSLNTLENISAIFYFSDGSIANLIYTAVGTTSYPKERMEIFADGNVIVLDDYKSLTIRGEKHIHCKNKKINKGHTLEFNHFKKAILGKVVPEVSHVDGIRTTLCCLKIFESIKTGKPVCIDINEVL